MSNVYEAPPSFSPLSQFFGLVPKGSVLRSHVFPLAASSGGFAFLGSEGFLTCARVFPSQKVIFCQAPLFFPSTSGSAGAVVGVRLPVSTPQPDRYPLSSDPGDLTFDPHPQGSLFSQVTVGRLRKNRHVVLYSSSSCTRFQLKSEI